MPTWSIENLIQRLRTVADSRRSDESFNEGERRDDVLWSFRRRKELPQRFARSAVVKNQPRGIKKCTEKGQKSHSPARQHQRSSFFVRSFFVHRAVLRFAPPRRSTPDGRPRPVAQPFVVYVVVPVGKNDLERTKTALDKEKSHGIPSPAPNLEAVRDSQPISVRRLTVCKETSWFSPRTRKRESDFAAGSHDRSSPAPSSERRIRWTLGASCESKTRLR